MIRVCVIDDHGLFRDGIRALFAATPDLRVVGEAGSAREAYEVLAGCACDVILLDVILPGSNGIAALRELRRRGFAQPILVVSSRSEDDFVREALAAGANGWALKEQRHDELVEAVRTVVGGGRYLSPRLAASIDAGAPAPGDGDWLGALSAREREVFDLLLRGYDNTRVARELFISVRTVETHRAHLLRKLGLHSLTDLVRFAARHRLLPPEAETMR